MANAFIHDAIRTSIGKLNGALASTRADDLVAIPIKALIARNPGVDWQAVDDAILVCANHAGEDNRDVAHGRAAGRTTRGGSGGDEHPRLSSLEALARLTPVVCAHGTVTAGNASGLNDGAAAMLLASEAAATPYG